MIEKIGFKKTDVSKESYHALITLVLLFIASILIGAFFIYIWLEKDASIVAETVKKALNSSFSQKKLIINKKNN